MVQEVQTGIWITNETTLETIQAIGTSSVKIREWRQTTWHFTSLCEASWSQWAATKPDGSMGDKVQATLTIDSEYWPIDYDIVDWWIRIPEAWWYEIKLAWKWWGYATAYHYIRAWWEEYLMMTTNNSVDIIESSKILNLWKYEIVTLWAAAEAPGEWWATITDTITITKL